MSLTAFIVALDGVVRVLGVFKFVATHCEGLVFCSFSDSEQLAELSIR